MNDIDRIWERLESDFKALMGHHDRLTALESRPCNCSAASSAGSGGTTLNPSTETGAGSSATPSLPKSADAATGSSDPVSSAIRDDPNRPAWLTDEMLPLPKGTERVWWAHGIARAYPGKTWYRPAYGAWDGYACDEDTAGSTPNAEVYHVPPPAPVAKVEPEMSMEEALSSLKRQTRKAFGDNPPKATVEPAPAGETAWERWSALLHRLPRNAELKEHFDRFVASEVAAAKAPGYHDVDEFYREEPPNPHAETAEEVAWRTARDVLDTVFNCNGQGYGNMLDKLTPIITAAIKRERGEA